MSILNIRRNAVKHDLEDIIKQLVDSGNVEWVAIVMKDGPAVWRSSGKQENVRVAEIAGQLALWAQSLRKPIVDEVTDRMLQ